MKSRVLKWLAGGVTGLCLLAAVIAGKMDAHWAIRALLWCLALAGLGFATWHRRLPETRDLTARAAQPGLCDGSTYTAGDHGGAGGDSGGG